MKKITDKERLDWLVKVLNKSKKRMVQSTWFICGGYSFPMETTLRQAIDAEIRKERK